MSSVLDIIGPIMIGPSSSHTAGAARLGLVAYHLLGEKPVRATITLYGSFAKTYRGHGTDRALVAGIMGMRPDDVRLRTALEIARDQGLDVRFAVSGDDVEYPNTARIELETAQSAHVELVGSSIGGGAILVTGIDGMAVNISAQRTTFIVLHRDVPGLIAAVTDVLAEVGVNICDFHLARKHKVGDAVMSIEVEGTVDASVHEQIQHLSDVTRCLMLQPV